MENYLNLYGDCIEAVYHEVCDKKVSVPIDKMKKIIDKKTKPTDYEVVKNIAKGGYGEVFLVKKDNIYAMKRVPKDLVLKQPNTALFMAEKEAMVDSYGSDWLVYAHMTMQDGGYLYYIMDFIAGGDLMGLLSMQDVLEEDWVKFYAAEIVAALDELHKLGWIHRDLKPDNVLIGSDGHIKLADFGSCIKMINGKAKSSITVGTPDYVSPDVLTSINEECEYGENVDFWTLGVIIYEMIYGTTPFYSETLMSTYKKITNVEFTYPFSISENLTDLINKLIAKKESRIGIEEIKSHPFFNGVDWNNVKKMIPPFIPQIQNETDTSNFIDTHFEADQKKEGEKDKYLEFVGFTYDETFINKLKETQEFVGNNLDNQKPFTSQEFVDNKVESQNLLVTTNKLNEEISTLEEKINCLNLEIKNLEKDKVSSTENLSELKNNVEKHKKELKCIMMTLLTEREELEEVKVELSRCSKQLKSVTEDINEKKSLEHEIFNTHQPTIEYSLTLVDLVSTVQPIKREIIECVKNIEVLNELVKCIQKEKENLEMEINLNKEKYSEILSSKVELESEIKFYKEKNGTIQQSNINFNKTMSDSALTPDVLKKQLRLKSNEIKEYQQKLDQEILLRKKIEEELNYMKSEKSKLKATISNLSFNCTLFEEGEITLKIENDTMFIKNEFQYLNCVYIRELKNNELHHLNYKKRSLTVRISFIEEIIKSVSSCGRRNLKALERDLNTEISIKEGIETMLPLLKGKTKDDAILQLAGSEKKIKQLKEELEMGRKSTMTEEIPDDPIRIYEFNNHLFASKTVPQGTLCDHCSEILYGLVDQGFECQDCKMIVHKSCYVLGDVSCELHSALKNSRNFYVTMKTIEDKNRLLAINK